MADGRRLEPLITAAEVGELLKLSPSTVLDWFEAGRLPGFKLGRAVRFRESEVLAWIEEQRIPARVDDGGRDEEKRQLPLSARQE